MNFAAIARVLAGFVAFFTVAQLFPLVLSLTETPGQRGSAPAGFAGSIGFGALAALLLWLGGRRAPIFVAQLPTGALALLSPGFWRR